MLYGIKRILHHAVCSMMTTEHGTEDSLYARAEASRTPDGTGAGGCVTESAEKDIKIIEDVAVCSKMAVSERVSCGSIIAEDNEENFSGMTIEKLKTIRKLSREVNVFIRQHGIQALDFAWLKENGGDVAYKLGGKGVKIGDIAKELGLEDAMNKHERDKLLAGWKAMVDKHGLDVYKQKWLQDNKLTQILTRSKRRGLRLIDVAKELGDDVRLQEQRAKVPKNGKIKWSAEKFDEIAREVIDKFGCIPSGAFLESQGYGGFNWQFAVYGPIEEIRKRHNVQNVRLCDVNGNILLSLSEVCFANYMIARNVRIANGEPYPDEYAEKYNRTRGVYDFHFIATEGVYAGKRISVEIFGGGRACGDMESKKRYEDTKRFKLEFHKNDNLFLAIDFKDCYADMTLTKVLKSYIGTPPIVRKHELVKLCPTTQLSQADHVLDECKNIASRTENGILPSTDWFQMTGKHKNRKRFDWEPHRWAGFLVKLRRIGMEKVREALGEEGFKRDWTDNLFKHALNDMLKEGYVTPSQAKSETKVLVTANRHMHDKYKRLDSIWKKMTDLPQTKMSVDILLDGFVDVETG